MTSDTRLHVYLALAGLAAIVVAGGWWWLIFSQVVASGYLSYAQAATCLAGATDLCTLAQALCKTDHLYGIRWYAPEAFWAGAAVLGTGLALSSRRLAE